MWNIDPEELGEIIYGEEVVETLTPQELEEYFGSMDNLNPDRIAIFTAKQGGEGLIDVAGFYKQTNPQPITTAKIKVTD